MPLGMILLYFFASASTAAILLYAYRLSRKYLLQFVSDYYHYLLISCSLGILGKPLPILIVTAIKLKGLQADQFMLIFSLLLAKPLWILSIYLLAKCIAALVGKKLSRGSSLVFFLFWITFLFIELLFTIGFFRTGAFAAGFRSFDTIDHVLNVSASLLIFGYGFVCSGKIKEKNRKRGARIFSAIGFLSKSVFWMFVFLQFSFTLPFLLNVLLPIPALLYLSLFLERSVPPCPGYREDSGRRETLLRRFKITPREMEVIGHICAGRSNREIAEALFISIHTVKRHTNQIYHKLGIRNRIQLANLIRETGNTDTESKGS
jgi:DNA-binding CsgD family transcriptional regulator